MQKRPAWVKRKRGKWVQKIQMRGSKKTRRGYNKAGSKRQARGWEKTGKK